METLKRQRGGIKGSLTNFKKFIDDNCKSINDITDDIWSQLESRLGGIEATLLHKFSDVQDRIETSCETGDLENEYNERYDFEDKYYSLVSRAKKYLNDYVKQNVGEHKGSSQTGSVVDPLQNVKLPDINLPMFDGSLHNWLEFRDIFESLIHSNEAISDIQRFHYLRASLKEEPAQIIATLEFCSSNYKIAWELLGKRYNNDKMLIHNHIKNIFSIETINRESSKGIRGMLNELTKNLRALNQLELPITAWDVPIVYLVSTKLDKTTAREWESFKSKCKKYPTLDELKAFLASKAELLDNLEQSKTEKIYDKRYNTKNLLVVEENNKDKMYKSHNGIPQCALCKSEHFIQICPKFLKIPIENRAESISTLRLCFNCLRPGHISRTCRRPTCKKCHGKHHVLLHKDKVFNKENINNDCSGMQNNDIVSLAENVIATNNNSASCEVSEVLLSTAIVEIFDKSNKRHTVRILLDSGSQSSFMTEKACARLGLEKENVNIALNGINSSFSTINYKCNTKIYSKFSDFSIPISCFVIPKITGVLPVSKIDCSKWKIPKQCKLADPYFYQPQEVDMLVGSDLFWSIIDQDKISLGSLCLQKTYLGWVVTGPLWKNNKSNVFSCNLSLTVEQQIQEDLRKFWELENCEFKRHLLSAEEMACESHFVRNTTRNADGAFVVKLPLKMDICKLGSSFNNAKKRFLSLEHKLNVNDDYKKLYHDFMNEYIQLGHMSKISVSETEAASSYYMSHHGVYREGAITTSLRVVFDASLPSCTGFSLNNILMVGPTIQQELFSILTRFRQHEFVITADCTKMYRSIVVAPEDRNMQKILWRFDNCSPIETYQLNTLTYGTGPASFIAIRCLFEKANEIESRYPDIADIIRNDFYVDDMLTGADSIEAARRITEIVFNTLKSGCLVLRKFVSNDPKILDCIPNNDPLSKIVEFGESDGKKTLGLIWSPSQDKLMFNVKKFDENTRITKRLILSNSSKIFDPLGMISPCIVVIKILLQNLWLEKLSWDDQVPHHLELVWLNFTSEVSCLNELKIERHAICKTYKTIEMHCFSDSSEKAYGACIYLRSVDESGNIFVNLLCSKAKVAPLQSVTLPRLELCGALVAAKLADKVLKALRLDLSKVYFWTDSTIVLGWVKTPPNKLKTFVGNRVSEIQNLTSHYIWRHVPGEVNPADYLSRGVKCCDIKYLDGWWHGPQFLYLDESYWPKTPCNNRDLPEIKNDKTLCIASIVEQSANSVFETFSNLLKLKRITALMRRFAYNCKVSKSERKVGPLLKGEIDHSFDLLLKQAQHECFQTEISQIKGKKLKSCKLLNLSPWIDEYEFLRVGGRLSNAKFDFEKKHPLILSPSHHLTTLILRHEHIKLYHCGAQHLLASIREKYWPISGRALSKRIVHDCVKCSRYNPKVLTPLMGNLPEQRLIPKHPFDVVGVDYAGPFLIKSRSGRGAKLIKSYVALYVCFITKAVHLELVTDMSTEAFILSLRRFSARRGKPSTVFSDNGSNFLGASSQLKELGHFIRDNNVKLTDGLCKEEVEWHFIPPQSPHFGGLWEAGVKTMKSHLKRVIGSTKLTFEHFYTFLCEVEAIMNSRPLSNLSSNPDDLTPLTPAHFLIGRQLSPIPSLDVRDQPSNRLSIYQHLQQMKQHIWSRWSKEYISELQQRSKWKENCENLKVGAIVLIKDDNAPPMKWKLGKVISVFPGKDLVARVALIKTETGIVKRCFTKICPLPIDC